VSFSVNFRVRGFVSADLRGGPRVANIVAEQKKHICLFCLWMVCLWLKGNF